MLLKIRCQMVNYIISLDVEIANAKDITNMLLLCYIVVCVLM